MAELEITLEITRPAVLAGESLTVVATVHNRGTAPVETPASGDTSPFTYALLREGESAPRYVLSQFLRRTMQSRNPPKDLPPRAPRILKPGESQSRREDLALLALWPLAPGRYRVSAQYQENQAPQGIGSIAIMRVEPRLITTEVCVNDKTLADLFVQEQTLYQRESQPTFPLRGVFYRRQTASAPVQDMTLSVNTEEQATGRWFAWIAGGALSVAKGWGEQLPAQFPAVQLPGFTPETLVRPGFHLGGRNGNLFIVQGHSGGQPKLAFVRFRNAGLMPEPALGNWSGGRPYNLRAQFEELDPANVLHLIWTDRAESSTSIYARTYRTDGKPVDATPRALIPPGSAILAWDVNPFATVDHGSVDVLLRLNEAEVLWRRIPAGGGSGGERAEGRLRLPSDATLGWAIAKDEQQAVVLMQAAHGFWVRSTAAEDHWRFVEAGPQRRGPVRLVNLENRDFWVEWLHNELGLVCTQLPATRGPARAATEAKDEEEEEEEAE